jgi:hypothetical protein
MNKKPTNIQKDKHACKDFLNKKYSISRQNNAIIVLTEVYCLESLTKKPFLYQVRKLRNLDVFICAGPDRCEDQCSMEI